MINFVDKYCISNMTLLIKSIVILPNCLKSAKYKWIQLCLECQLNTPVENKYLCSTASKRVSYSMSYKKIIFKINLACNCHAILISICKMLGDKFLAFLMICTFMLITNYAAACFPAIKECPTKRIKLKNL